MLDVEILRSLAAGGLLFALCFMICQKAYDTPVMVVLALVSLVGHFFVAFIFNYAFSSFGADSVEYHYEAMEVQRLLVNGAPLQAVSLFKDQIFTNIIAAVYLLFGASRMMMTFVVVFFSVAIGPVVHRTCIACGLDKRVGYFASVALWFMPGLVFFTSDLLRDSIVLFLTALVFYLFSLLLYRKNTRLRILLLSLAVIATIAVDTMLRFYIFVPIVAGLTLGLLIYFFHKKSFQYKIVVGVGLIILIGLFVMLSQAYLKKWLQFDLDTLFEYVDKTRTGFTHTSAGIPGFDIATLEKAVSALPTLIGHYLFQPFPSTWLATDGAFYIKLLIPDMILWYLMLPFLVIGIGVILKRTHYMGVTLLGYLITFLVMNALLVGNVGAIYRYRLQFQAFAFVLIGIGIVAVFFREKENLKTSVSKYDEADS